MAAEQAAAHFRNGPGEIDLYAFGEYASLVGDSTVGLVDDTPANVSASVEGAGRFVRVKPDSGWVPGFVHGELTGDIPRDAQVALALNGEVQTVVPLVSSERGAARFTAILPDHAFVEGFNSLDLFMVSGSSAAPRIIEAAFEQGTQFQLIEPSGSVVLRDSNGGSWRLGVDSPLVGYVDTATWERSGFEATSPMDLQLQGWAFNESTRSAADRIIFFADGEFAGSIRPAVERPGVIDLNDTESEELVTIGFLARLPNLDRESPPEVRVFAVSGETLAELVILDSALEGIGSS
jgi:hypothetical protein